MTYRLIKIFFAIALSNSISPTWAHDSCDVQSTPLINAGRCHEYIKLDRTLNAHYKKLMSDLDPKLRQKLREVQRTWIRWRDDKCDEVQESSGCNANGSCNGVAHDYCIIDLTIARDRELQKLLSNTDSINEKNLPFSMEYK
jgi:uncharacterized protein YecT (DUF1311 family)